MPRREPQYALLSSVCITERHAIEGLIRCGYARYGVESLLGLYSPGDPWVVKMRERLVRRDELADTQKTSIRLAREQVHLWPSWRPRLSRLFTDNITG